MVIKLKRDVREGEIKMICDELKLDGLESRVLIGETTVVVAMIGDETHVDPNKYRGFDCVEAVILVQEPYKLVSRRAHPEYNGHTKHVKVGDVVVGGDVPVIIAGPCAVENEKHTLEIARAVKAAGAHMLRGGAYKPRTSPYAFQGLKEEGLGILAQAKAETGLPIVTELVGIVDEDRVDLMELFDRYGVDMYQIGARNMSNYPLLKAVGRTKKPVMLKRGPSASLKELLLAAEYIAAEGNDQIVLCERGVNSSVNGEYSRNTLDLNVVPALRSATYLPVIVDPSHGTGYKVMVPGAAKAALEYGAHGLLLEVVRDNESPRVCDYAQSISVTQFNQLMQDINRRYK